MSNIVANREKQALENDRLMSERALSFQKTKIANELLGDMGKDMTDVLSGKVKVKMPFSSKVKYKVNYWINKLFNSL